MVEKKKKELMISAQVYFTKLEMIEIRKLAGKNVLKISPFLRQQCVQLLGLNGKG